jgi:hypothetical protein
MEGGLKVSIRPSGTEPKNKVYIEKASKPLGAGASDESFAATRQTVDREVEEFSNLFMKEMLAIVGVELPRYAMEISDLVALERKQHFAGEFIPGLAEKVAGMLRSQGSAETVGRWIDQELKSYGPDARLLVGKAFRSYLAAEREKGNANTELLAAEEEVFFESEPQPKGSR